MDLDPVQGTSSEDPPASAPAAPATPAPAPPPTPAHVLPAPAPTYPHAPVMTPQELREAYQALPPLQPVRARGQCHAHPQLPVDPPHYTPEELKQVYQALPVLRPVHHRVGRQHITLPPVRPAPPVLCPWSPGS